MKTNEEIIKIVDDNVYACQSSLVQDLLNNGYFSYDDIIQCPLYDVKGIDNNELKTMNFDELQDLIIEVEKNIEVCKSENDCNCQNQYEEYLDYLNHIESDYDALNYVKSECDEIYEWWLCSEWFMKKMEKVGYPILNNEYGTWWGRTTTGQAIWVDFYNTNILD